MFIDISEFIANNPPHRGHGVAVSDVDGDGRFEFLVTGYGVANRVLKWVGTKLEDVADPVLADVTGHTTCMVAADIDGDGREEIYSCNEESEQSDAAQLDRLFAPFGHHWLDLLGQAENAAAVEGIAGHAVAVIDRLGRGRYGFVVIQPGEPVVLYEMGPGGRLLDVAEDAGLDQSVAGPGVLALPLVSDRMDLFIHADGGANCLFRNLGDGTFEEVAEQRGLADPRQLGRGVTVLDADGNGLLDLVCAVRQGSHRLFLQRAGGGFTEEAPADFSLPSHATSVIAADFDNDGLEEVLFLNHGQPNRLFALRHEEWTEIDLGDAVEVRGASTGAAVADIDGDGLLEVLVNHDGHQPLALFKSAPNANGWLRVLPLTVAGAPARGALVLCVVAGRTQRRAICAGSGYLSQMEPIAHFGLGETHRVDRVEIRWPDGSEAVITNPPADRLLTVPHPPE